MKGLYFLTTVLFAALISCNGSGSFKESPNGMMYKIFGSGNGAKGKEGDYAMITNTIRSADGKVLFSTKEKIYVPIRKASTKGDPEEIFTLIGAGDSASIQRKAVDFFRSENNLPEGVGKDDLITMDVKVYDFIAKDKYEAMADSLAPSPTKAEDKQIVAWLKANKLEDKAKKTDDGLYYIIEEQGNGAPLKNGDKLQMNYTGSLLDGTHFDSNQLPEFHHVQPFSFSLGQGGVIKGWDEGIAFFNVGGKGKLIIPSRLGYGSQGQAKIPANSILVFDVQVLSAN